MARQSKVSKKVATKKKTSGFMRPKNLIEAYVLNREFRSNPLFKLPDITPEFEEAYVFFDKLLQDGTKNKEYSVKDIAAKKGVLYEQVLEWAKQNDMFAFGFDMGKQACFVNALRALTYDTIEYEKGVRYCVENANEDCEEHHWLKEELEKIEAREENGQKTKNN